ncbi:MAG: DUF2220 family protein [Clostridiales bacterium]|nr:DUF2220 family protein [Clostridiales bacterium]
MKDIRKYNYKRIDTLNMQKYLSIDDYNEFVKVINELETKNIITPVKSSKLNGKRPPLYNRYNILPEQEDYSAIYDELMHKLNYRLNSEYYLKHPKQYEKDRPYVLKLSGFLNDRRYLLNMPISENERSFQIWNREKYLRSGGGKRLLNNLRFPIEMLNIYSTTEPLAYFSVNKNTPQKILIIENMDTFYTMRRYLLTDGEPIFGENIATVMYGRGKDIWRTFNDFGVCMESYLLCRYNEILYLGDLDYEGILIFEELHENFKVNFLIHPFVKAYNYMVDKSIKENMDLPKSKKGQNKNLKGIFVESFPLNYRERIDGILESGRYIPQEIINLGDLKMEKIDES